MENKLLSHAQSISIQSWCLTQSLKIKNEKYFIYLNKSDGTGAARLLQAEDAPTHYLDCNSFIFTKLSKDSVKILHNTTNNKDKHKKWSDKCNFKKRDFSSCKEKIDVGKLYNNTMIN